MKIDIWADVVCPFCYLGKRHLEAALADFPGREDVTIHWRSFQLDPSAPTDEHLPTAQMLAKKYGLSPEQTVESQAGITASAAAVGLDYHLDATVTGNTFDVHRVIKHAIDQGLGDEAVEAFFDAYFTQGRVIFDRAVILELADEIGLPRAGVEAVLDGEAHADQVRADADQARAYGATGVPFFVFNDAVGVSGAQPVEVFGQALAQAAVPKSKP